MSELVLKVRSLKMLSWQRLIGENVGWKMVYNFLVIDHGLQSRPPSPKRAERKVRRRPFREAGSGQNNGTR